jgi:hypothetical protein
MRTGFVIEARFLHGYHDEIVVSLIAKFDGQKIEL